MDDGVGVEFSPDDKMLLITSLAGTMTLWDAQTGTRFRVYSVEEPDYGFVATFSLDGKTLLSAGKQLTICDATPYPNGVAAWVHENRYIPSLTCQQRDMYQVKPLCDNS